MKGAKPLPAEFFVKETGAKEMNKKIVEENKRQEELGEKATKAIVDYAANPWQQRQTTSRWHLS